MGFCFLNFYLPVTSFDHFQVNRENGMTPARRLVHRRAAGGTSCRSLDQAVGRVLGTVDTHLGQTGYLDVLVDLTDVQRLLGGRQQVVQLLLVQFHERAGDRGREIDILVQPAEDVDDDAGNDAGVLVQATLVVGAHRVRLARARLAVG